MRTSANENVAIRMQQQIETKKERHKTKNFVNPYLQRSLSTYNLAFTKRRGFPKNKPMSPEITVHQKDISTAF